MTALGASPEWLIATFGTIGILAVVVIGSVIAAIVVIVVLSIVPVIRELWSAPEVATAEAMKA